MTVLHVVHSLEGGGTERALVRLLRGLRTPGLRHVVVTLRGAGDLSVQLPDHVACQALNIEGRSRTGGLRLGKAARKWQATVIHARNTGCWMDALVASLVYPKAQVVLGFHGAEHIGPLTRRQRLAARFGVWCGAKFTSVSESGRSQLIHEARVSFNRISHLPNGVDVRRFRPVDADKRRRVRQELGISERDLVVGTVGSLTPVKNYATLVEAIALLTNFIPAAPSATSTLLSANPIPMIRLVVVGDGPRRAQLETLTKAKGLRERVHFLGKREDVPRLLGAFDLFACPSLYEGMSHAVLEAMAAGLPVVVTNVGDNPILVREGLEGYVVKPSCPDDFAKAFLPLLSNSVKRVEMGRCALERAASFSLDRFVQSYEEFYWKLHNKGVIRGEKPYLDGDGSRHIPHGQKLNKGSVSHDSPGFLTEKGCVYRA